MLTRIVSNDTKGLKVVFHQLLCSSPSCHCVRSLVYFAVVSSVILCDSICGIILITPENNFGLFIVIDRY